jgi:transcription-repair coupling factor (superfamily II helicase)
MNKIISLSTKLNESNKNLIINGLKPSQWIFLREHFLENKNRQVFIFKDQDDAESFYNAYKHQQKCLFYPDLCENPYSGQFSSDRDLLDRFLCLSKLISKEDFIVFTTFRAINLFMPTVEYFANNSLTIESEMIISPQELANKLVLMGYKNNPTIEEPGTFTMKGEIFDIYPINTGPIRINYFDELIETISKVDISTLRTIKDEKIEKLTLSPSPASVVNSKNSKFFLKNLDRITSDQKEKYKTKEYIIESLSNNYLFTNFPLYLSLFLEDKMTLKDHLIDLKYEFNFINYDLSLDDFHFFIDELNSTYQESIKSSDGDIFPNPILIYNQSEKEYPGVKINEIDMHNDNESFNESVSLSLKPFTNQVKSLFPESANDKNSFLSAIKKFLKKKSLEEYKLYFSSSKSNFHKFKELYQDEHFVSKFIHTNSLIDSGFIYESEKIIVISEEDLFVKKITKAKSREASDDIFAEQLSTLKIDDYVIHKEHGVGKYLGIETIEIGKQKGDFLIIQYTEDDKVYVPVYKLNLIQKYSSSESTVKVASLKSKKFDSEKSKAKKSVKKLAFDLLELQAKRKLKKGFRFKDPDKDFFEFVDNFSFKDTPDQALATEDVISDMCSDKPMDRLVCGDVGFGKTEIAMRASFLAVENNKQVAILVPTTVLAFQHYNSFKKRFKEFGINIEYLSRFKSTKESKEIVEKLENGKIDIVIGTHKLISDKIIFKDLGLLVVDEEQRFGVSHKEKIKLFKENVDTLTLTATPIPRTLQMSFLGIKDLSIIKTAPPKRQSIKTYLIKEDLNTIKNALQKELSRGGQVFVVHNKVKDIEDYTSKISKLSPEARIIYAHGQLNERELEKRITDFYKGKYDILVSTTIIESGIDIPSANTMIIDRADTYGLSQLHQLRGRIGRSDKKAYAYFVIPKNKLISTVAAKRLKALQTYAEMGSGFNLATSDLEIRGSGDILGAEQSGHIANIGLELYMDLLKEAINEIKNTKGVPTRNIEMQTPFNAFINNNYIEDSGLRLKYYKKISGSKSNESLDSIKSELIDLYGNIPKELNNLFVILYSRNYLNKLPIDSVKVTSKQIHLDFNSKELDQNPQLKEKLIAFFMERPKVYKIKPNYSVICSFKDIISTENLLEFSKYIAMQMEAC